MASHIIVFGSLNVDLVFGLERLPLPGETVICPRYDVFPGGKGANQAVAAARAGASVRMAGCVGRDGFGELLVRSLQGAGVDTDLLRRIDEPTGCAAIGVDRAGANQIIVAGGANLKAPGSLVDDGLLTPQTTLLMQMEVDPRENWELIARAEARGARLLLNVAPAAPVPAEILRKVDILVVNQVELSTIARYCGLEPSGPSASARALSEVTGQTCVVTLGAHGAFACQPGGSWHVRRLEVDPVDTTAAGDCFVGWLAARLTCGDPLPAALRWASVASGIACLSLGAQPSLPQREEVAARLNDVDEATPV
jgi:ribokinase